MGGAVTVGGTLAFPNEWLHAVELQGRESTAEISKVTIEELRTVDGGEEPKLVLAFKDRKKKLVCNVTNANSIAEAHGTDADKWVGKSVTLYPTTCLAFGETVDCIRVK